MSILNTHNTMDFKKFMTAVKSIKVVPEEFFQTRLCNAIKFSNDLTKQTFFAELSKEEYSKFNKGSIQAKLEELSTIYISFLISKTILYGFDKTIISGMEERIENWFLRNTNTVGQNIMIDYLLQPSVLGAFETNNQSLAKSIADNTASDQFLTAFLVESDTIGTLFPVKMLLMLLKLIDNSGENYRKVHKEWVGNSRWEEIKDFETYPWLEMSLGNIKENASIYKELKPSVTNAITKAEPPVHYVKTSPGFKGSEIRINRIRSSYGLKAASWVTTIAKSAGLNTGVAPVNVTDIKDTSGCLTAGTEILLSDGNVKSIEKLVPGDSILTATQSIAICSGELTPNNSVEGFYSVNDDKPFMSFDHMVMTQRGWVSLSPVLSQENHPHLQVSRIQIGDVIWKVKNVKGREIEYEKVRIEKINIHDCKTQGQLMAYSLHQRGEDTNHPNGYCCHNGYPDISLNHIAANAETKLEINDQIELQKGLEELSPQLEKILGKGALSMVKATLKNSRNVANKVKHTNDQGKLINMHKGAKHLVAPKFELNYLEGEKSLLEDFVDFSVVNGHCFIDNKIVESETDGNDIFWSRVVNGKKEEGAFRMFTHGMLGQGHVIRGGSSVSFLARGLYSYDLSLGDNNEKWLQLEMGFVDDENGNSHAVGFLKDPTNEDKSEELKKYSNVIFSQVEDDGMEVLHALVSFNKTYVAYGGSDYIEAEFNFTLNYKNLSGTAIKYDNSKDDLKGESVLLLGKAEEVTKLRDYELQLSDKLLSLPIQTQFLTNSVDSLPKKNQAFTGLTAALTVEELFSLPMPDLKDVHESSFAKLKDLMMLALDKTDKQTLTFFGETAPSVGPNSDLTPDMASLLDDNNMSDFFTKKFATGYLTQSFCKSDDEKIKPYFDSVKNIDDKLSYFWKGNGSQSFVTDSSYTKATSLLNNYVYAQKMHHLQDYILDGGEKWAKALYEYCTDPLTLNGLAMQNSLGGRKRLTHLCTVLQTLDSKGKINAGKKTISYSTALYEKVIEKRLTDFTINSTLSDKEAFNEYLVEYFTNYINSINDPSSSWSAEVRAKAKEELNQLRELIGAKTEEEFQANIRSIISNASGFIGNLTGNNPMGMKIQNWAKDYASRSAGKAKAIKIGSIIGKTITMGVYAFGVSQVIQAFMGWDKLSKAQQVSVVSTSVNIAASIFSDLASWRYASVLATKTEKFTEIVEAVNYIEDGVWRQADFTQFMETEALDMSEVGESPTLIQAGKTVAEGVNEYEEISASVAKWSKISTVGEIAARGFGIIALGAAAVVTGFSIADDFASGQPASVLALDIISEISTAVSFIVEVGSGIAAIAGVEILSAIPVIGGAIAAVVGVLVSIIMLFIHRNPPPSPVELYVKNVCIPFLNNLPLPSKEWLDAQKKAVEHLTGGKSKSFMIMFS